MRIWVLILMIAVAFKAIPVLRNCISITTSLLYRNLPQALVSANHFTSDTRQQGPKAHTTIMTESLPQQNPMPVLSKAGPADVKKTQELPKLSTEDFRVYNRLAVMMDAYHNHFRHTWNMLYQAARTGQRPAGVSIRGYIHMGLQLCSHLTVHHTIEERYIFPELAQRMPGFNDDEVLIHQHEQIHDGLEKVQKYLEQCQSGEKELRMNEMKDIMDSFGEVLWTHLDEEVRMLGADNVRRYYTKQEVMEMEW